MRVTIGEKEFKVKVAESDASRKRGLKGVTKMPKDSGLCLKFQSEQDVPITMKGMKIPIDIIFSRQGKVQEVRSAGIDSDDILISAPSDLVIEVNRGEAAGIRTGDKVELLGAKQKDGTIVMASGGVAAKPGEMQVLDEDGKNQMNIKGNERIYSRKHTTKLVKLATKADESKEDKDYKKLGKAMVDIIHEQDTQEQEYVEN